MSEADLRASQHQSHPAVQSDNEPLQSNFAAAGGFEPIAPQPTETPARVPQQPEEDWQTVDFPNALSVDAIPTTPSANNLQSQTQVPPISDNLKNLLGNAEQRQSKGSTPVTLMQALHECNRDLLQRIAQLETALEESQKTWQNRETLLEQRTAELENTQEQLTRLFGKVEVSHHTLQDQEILVESLSSKLATSQTRLAIVERECASTVQRYNEQFHQLVATENVCRELRSRLHRQQRHTLQFKAALEKSLEMPQKSPIIEPPDDAEDSAHKQLESLLAAVKSSQVPLPPAFNPSPVKAWSDPEEHPEVAPAEYAIDPEPIANPELNKLAQASGIQLQETETSQQSQEAVTDLEVAVEEPELQITESQPETVAAKLGSEELARAVQILNSVETFGIQEVRSSEAIPTAIAQPDWLTLIASPLRASKKRRSLAEIELPSFR
jgi:myosin heavy subunit